MINSSNEKRINIIGSACTSEELELEQLFGRPVSIVNELASSGQPATNRYIFGVRDNRMYGQLVSGAYVSSQSNASDNSSSYGKKALLDLNELTPEEFELYKYNMQHRDAEPEDEPLVDSGVLHKLLAQAEREPPTEDWEQELAEL